MATRKNSTIAIDFDGVIHQRLPFGREMGIPIEGARDHIRLLWEHYNIIIFTARPAELYINQWLERHGIPFDEVTNQKPMAEFYIDDRAIRFEDWKKTIDFIKQNMKK